MNMNGWDTIFAASTAYANNAMAQHASQLLPSVDTQVSGALGTFTISAQFGPWQIVPGGSGQLIHVLLPITSGTFTCPGGDSYSLAGYQPIMQFSLQLVGTSGPSASQQLLFDIQQAGQLGQPAAQGLVTPFAFAQSVPITDLSLQRILLNGLASGIAQQANAIIFAFASVGPVPSGTNSWLAPRNCAFAYYEVASGASGYLVIFSTRGAASSLPTTIDPSLFAGNVPAAFAIGLPLFLANVTLPSLVSVFPGSSAGQFVVNGTPAGLSLAKGSSLQLGGQQVGAITYDPQITSLSLAPGDGAITATANGECNLYGGCSMTFTATATNQFVFDQHAGTCSFQGDSNPSVHHDTSVPWWYLFGGALAYAIANTVAAVVADKMAGLIGGQVGSNTLSAAPPASVQFAGMQNFTASNVSFDGALVMQAG